MPRTPPRFRTRPLFHAVSGALLLLAFAHGAHAQTLYRSVGPNGRVTYSDRAAAEPRAETSRVGDSAPAPSSASAAALPYELRETAKRYPVTLYTGRNCAPCASARGLLIARGVPFSERSVISNDDIAALRSLSGAQSLPFATIGGQHLKGFSEAEWTQYLDAAGYPKKSMLPPGWRPAEPTPLVAAKKVEPPASPADDAARGKAPAAPAAARPPAANPASNPAGIRF